MTLPPELAAYAAANDVTRAALDRALTRQYRLKRQKYWLNVLGLITGLIVALSFLGVSAWLIDGDHTVAGTILGSVDLVALVTVFVTSNRRL